MTPTTWPIRNSKAAMSWSLSEVQALAVKAVRGAGGFPHGLAEEAGAAVRWLSARDLPGAQALANYLDAVDRGAGTCPVDAFPPATATGESPYCPIRLGTAILDQSLGLARSDSLALGAVRQPLLLLPFASLSAQGRLCLSWEGRADGYLLAPVANCRLSLERGVFVSGSPDRFRVGVAAAAAIATLEAFAYRTYASATESSRRKGAGAGTTDND